jgi:NAD(P)-dependent dehydrogenase (short-subunit alcohol dehydrogenase family)
MRLRGKTVIVTGAASGIGKAIAQAFAAEGAQLCLVDRDEALLAALPQALGGSAGHRLVAGDVTDESLARQTIGDVAAAWSRLDIVVTAAGISLGKPAHETTLANWQEVLLVNVTGTFLWVREALRPMMAQRSGAIVTIASQLARAGGRNNCAYVTSKGAVTAFSRTIAVDYAEQGIRCNTILPGATETPLLQRSFGRQPDPGAARERSRLRHAMGRFGRAEEIAQAALYLASDEASFTTGIELPVDGGWLAA